MHELGFATELVATLEQLMDQEGITLIREVTLKVGEATGVVPRYLLECWPAAIEDSRLPNCELKIDYVKAKARCRDCGKEYVASLTHGICPECGSDQYDLNSGYEFEVVEIRGK